MAHTRFNPLQASHPIEDSSEASLRYGPDLARTAANASRDQPNLVFAAAVARLKLLFWGRSTPSRWLGCHHERLHYNACNKPAMMTLPSTSARVNFFLLGVLMNSSPRITFSQARNLTVSSLACNGLAQYQASKNAEPNAQESRSGIAEMHGRKNNVGWPCDQGSFGRLVKFPVR